MSSARLRVAVIIPTYNRATLLPAAIDSLLNQTRVPDEIIVVDDGSTDNSAIVLAAYGAPVIVIRQENRGRSAARNEGLRHTSCDLIAFLDSDDTLPPTSIERRAQFLEASPTANFVYTASCFQNFNDVYLGWFRKPPLPTGSLFHELMCRSVFPIHAAMFRRSCISELDWFDEARDVHEDLEFWQRLSLLYPFEAINEPLANYRVQDGAVSSTFMQHRLRAEIQLRQSLFSTVAFTALGALQQARIYSVHATQHFQLGDLITARKWYRQAIRTAPTYLRPYLLLLITVLGKGNLEILSQLYHRLKGEPVRTGG